MPLEFAVAAFRFGHTMVRLDYDFNVNFNTSGLPSIPATLDLLFVFTALSGQLGGGPVPESETLPENWIIEWQNFVGETERGEHFVTEVAQSRELTTVGACGTSDGTVQGGTRAHLIGG